MTSARQHSSSPSRQPATSSASVSSWHCSIIALPAGIATPAARIDQPLPRNLYALALELLTVAEPHGDAAGLSLLVRGHECHTASVASSGRRTDTVHIALVVLGRVEAITWVMSARSSPRAATSVAMSVFTLPAGSAERPLARTLGHVSVQRDRGNVSVDELRRQTVGPALRPDEHECEPAFVLELGDQRVDLPVLRDGDEPVLSRAGGGVAWWIGLEAAWLRV